MPWLLLRPLCLIGSRVAMATAAPPCAAAQRRLASKGAPSAGRKRPYSSTNGRGDEVGSVVFLYLSSLK